MCPTRRLSPKQTNACLHFHCAAGFATQRLARMLHSLVRVSRRVGCSHLITNNCSARCDRSPARADIRPQTLHAVPEAVPKRPGAAQTRRPTLPVILSHLQTSRPMAISIAPRSEHLPTGPHQPQATVVGQLAQECRGVDSYPESKAYRLLQTGVTAQHRS